MYRQLIMLTRDARGCYSGLRSEGGLGWAGVNGRGLWTFTAVRPPVAVSASRRHTIGAFRVSSPPPRDYMDLGAPLPFGARPTRLCAGAGRLSTGAAAFRGPRIVLDGPGGRCYDDRDG